MKRRNSLIFLSICLTSLLLVLSILTGCSGETATTTPPVTTPASSIPAAASTTAPATTALPSTTVPPAQVIKLKFYNDAPPSSTLCREAEIMAKALNDISNGRLEVTVYPAQQLGPANAVLDLLKNGVTDFAQLGTPLFPTLFPLEIGQEIAMTGLPDWVAALNMRNQLTRGNFGQAFTSNNLKFVTWSVVRPSHLFLTKKVNKAEDLNGLKIRTPNPIQLEHLKQFGVVPVSMPMGDVYESLQRGVIDGVVNAPENAVANKWYEVTKFYLQQSLAYGGNVQVISQNSWNKIPADIQALFDQAYEQWLPQAVALYQTEEIKAIETMKASGVDVYTLEASEAARWVQLQAHVIDEWAAKTEAPGVSAKAMVEEIRKAVQ